MLRKPLLDGRRGAEPEFREGYRRGRFHSRRREKTDRRQNSFRLLVGGTPAYLRLQIGIVDARNGEVLLYTDPVLVGDPTTAVDRLRKALELAAGS